MKQNIDKEKLNIIVTFILNPLRAFLINERIDSHDMPQTRAKGGASNIAGRCSVLLILLHYVIIVNVEI